MRIETRAADVFAAEIREAGERLLHHQCWFFGRDIHHPAGNLLCRCGFERLGVTDGKDGSNRYRLSEAGGAEINLWGWGVFFGDGARGGIFIKRYDFRPRLFETGRLNVSVFKSENLPPSRLPREDFQKRTARTLTADLIGWILRYEDWVEKTCGASWRRKNLRDWKNAAMKKSEIKRGWKSLRESLLNYENA
jgi:hypothetical protein